MGRKCSVQGCLSDSNRVEDVGVTFHKVPMQSEVRLKWLQLCKISEEKKSIKVIYVCSRHFLRADFCNFKGKKYMLRQGVFPSVFPWDKSKLEAIKSEKQQNKAQIATNSTKINLEKETEVKIEDNVTDLMDQKDLPAVSQGVIENESISTNHIDFYIDNRIYALDFNNKWCPAKIKEVDEEENEVLLHFESDGNEYDEWVCMDSPRLRPFSMKEELLNIEENPITESLPDDVSNESVEEPVKEDTKSGDNPIKYNLGENCMAFWSEKKKFAATVTKVMNDDTYEVCFEDGYVKCLKWDKMIKVTTDTKPPLFAPIVTSKEERREKKRKLNVVELFGLGKRQRSESTPNSPKVKMSSNQTENVLKNLDDVDMELEQVPVERSKDEILEEDGSWLPRWVDGHPVGIVSELEFQDGKKKSVIVPDPRLPEGWAKHLYRRSLGMGGNKWDTIITSPDGKKLRSKTDIKNYLEQTKLLPYDERMFDFRITLQRQKKVGQITEPKKNTEVKPIVVKPQDNNEQPTPEINTEDEVNLLKIPLVEDGYKCPIEGCDKSFRKENLAQMHVKHYHPEYSKYLDTTPNVADLAYARTVGDSLDKSPVPSKSSRIKPTPKPQQIQQPNCPIVEEAEAVPPPSARTKDAEIIKLLSAKPFVSKSEGEPLPSGLPPNMYPDIKLKDLLSKSEGVPKRDDINLKSLGGTRPPSGIKTLLPVRKPENKIEEEPVTLESTPKIKSKLGGKRKKIMNEQLAPIKPKEIKEEYPPALLSPAENSVPPENNDVIIEGGELIKIVRMKQEEIINCTCGFMEEDGLMIQCELCLCWQHAYCNNIQKESEVPDKYVCYICQHPLRQRNSKKFYHDQDWLKQGVLPVGSYHSKDEELLQKRFDKLKKSHDISGGLGELQEFVNTLKVKLKIAEAKNHPKLYLWSKPWEKLPLPEKMEDNQENTVKEENLDEKLQNEEENQLTRDLKSMIDLNQPQVPIIPQPEAAIETADCKLNLLDHVLHSQNLVMERLDDFEKELENLEENLSQLEKDEEFPRTRQTLQMLMRDLNRLEELSQNTSI